MSMPPLPPASRNFRAVIVGGGPAGLCLAHAFSKAQIEYVLLERRDTVVEESGFGLALWPHGVRILDQLGLLEEGRQMCLVMKDKFNLRPDGSEINHNRLYEKMEENHGHPWSVFRRQKLLELMYNRLPEKEVRIKHLKKVVSIETHDHGVKVCCEDGSVEEGSIVIGCDGVHSKVRRIMRELALKSSGKVSDPESPMMARHQLLAIYLNRVPDMEIGRLWEVRDNKMSIQVFMGENEGWLLAYRKLPKPTNQYTPYTDADVEAVAKGFMDHPIEGDRKFKDLWGARKWARLVDIEEGQVKTWHFDRIVLVGDAVHKMTPNAGLSLNQGWQGVVALTNSLHRLLATVQNPNDTALTKAFQEYQSSTGKMAKGCLLLSKLYIRVTTWDNFVWKLADSLAPYLGGDLMLLRMLASPIVRRGLILDGLPEAGYKAGLTPWANKAFAIPTGE